MEAIESLSVIKIGDFTFFSASLESFDINILHLEMSKHTSSKHSCPFSGSLILSRHY